MGKAIHRGMAFKSGVQESNAVNLPMQSPRRQAEGLYRKALPANAVILHH